MATKNLTKFANGQLADLRAERAYRRGFVHALNEIVYYAENVPPEFRAWANANLEVYEEWRSDLKTVALPPPLLPYRREIVDETEYTQPCPDCMGYGHPVSRSQGWRVLCTGCVRRTPYFKKKLQALKAWNELTKSSPATAGRSLSNEK